jgi:hypothetical protein
MSSSANRESADLIRIVGRAIMAVNLAFGAGVLVTNLQVAEGTVTMDLLPASIALIFGVSGTFAWATLRAMAQIRDRTVSGAPAGGTEE